VSSGKKALDYAIIEDVKEDEISYILSSKT
jgi:hypothetical protein